MYCLSFRLFSTPDTIVIGQLVAKLLLRAVEVAKLSWFARFHSMPAVSIQTRIVLACTTGHDSRAVANAIGDVRTGRSTLAIIRGSTCIVR